MSNDYSFSLHIEKAVSAANKLTGWALRSFHRRSRQVMFTIWKTLVQPKLDYCSVLWSPPDQGSIARLESVCRNFTSQVAEFESLDYWERLAELEIYSQERRRERYSIMFMWKISQQLVQGYNVEFMQNPRRGRLAVVPSPSPCTAPARETSFKVQGSRLFNLIPMELRGVDGSVVKFKASLDS